MEREKKHESILVVFCIILAWIYGKLPKIPKITKKCPDCDIHGLWLKDAFKNDQYLHFIRSFLSNWYDIIFSSFSTCHFARALTCFPLESYGPLKVTKANTSAVLRLT